MNNITSKITTWIFLAASVVLWVSDQIYMLPIPPEWSQYWLAILATAFAINLYRQGKLDKKAIADAIDAWVKTFPVDGKNEKNTAEKKNETFL